MKSNTEFKKEELIRDLVWRVENSQVLGGTLPPIILEATAREILSKVYPVLYGKSNDERRVIHTVSREHAQREGLPLAPAAQVYAALEKVYQSAKRFEERQRAEEDAVFDELYAEREQPQILRDSGCGCMGGSED